MIQEEKPTKQQIPWPVVTQDMIDRDQIPGEQIQVRCIDPRGLYYAHVKRRQGDVFTLKPKMVTVTLEGEVVKENGKPKMRLVTAKEQFSATTMEMVDPGEPETITTAQQALNRQQDEINETKRPRR